VPVPKPLVWGRDRLCTKGFVVSRLRFRLPFCHGAWPGLTARGAPFVPNLCQVLPVPTVSVRCLPSDRVSDDAVFEGLLPATDDVAVVMGTVVSFP
jgi:hypothetical protein